MLNQVLQISYFHRSVLFAHPSNISKAGSSNGLLLMWPGTLAYHQNLHKIFTSDLVMYV